MSTKADQFRRDLGRVLGTFASHSEQFRRALTLEALRRLVLRTPVRTGRARGSWQVTADAPATSAPLSVDPTGGATIAKGAGEIAKLSPGHDAFICSNLVYMPALEKGHSKQAPAGMVAVTLEELKLISDRLAVQVVHGEQV